MSSTPFDPVGRPPALDKVHTPAAEAWFARLLKQIDRDTDPTPQIVAREQINGETVHVVDVTAYPGSPDLPIQRGFQYQAFTGNLRLVPAPDCGEVADLCRVEGGTLVGHGPTATAALDEAHRHLTGRAPTTPTAGASR